MSTHPPIANKVVCIDFDGTIVPWGPLMSPKDPFPGVAHALRDLKRAGYRIVIFTSRLSTSWLRDRFGETELSGLAQTEYIVDVLNAAGIPFDAVTADKIPAEVYFDDKGVQISQDNPLTQAVEDWLRHQAVELAP